jgi:hypothetical protein
MARQDLHEAVLTKHRDGSMGLAAEEEIGTESEFSTDTTLDR